MKILYIVTNSDAGGAQTYVAQLASHMKELGHEVAVMSRGSGWLSQELQKNNIRYYENPFFAHHFSPINILKAMHCCRKAIGQVTPDIVHCNSSFAGLIGALSIFTRRPMIFTAHGWPFVPRASFWMRIVGFLSAQITARYAAKIICVSEFDVELAKKWSIAEKNKLICIHNGIEMVPADGIRGKMESSPVRIIFVGRLSSQKDPLLLLRAFFELQVATKNICLDIVGEGPLRPKLERFIRQHKMEQAVRLVGEVPRPMVWQMLKLADIFTLISNFEACPYSVLEAMSAGIAIIVSNVGGVKELISDRCGILVPVRDKEGIKKALAALIEDAALRDGFAREARRQSLQFSLDKMLEKTKKVYHENFIQPHNSNI